MTYADGREHTRRAQMTQPVQKFIRGTIENKHNTAPSPGPGGIGDVVTEREIAGKRENEKKEKTDRQHQCQAGSETILSARSICPNSARTRGFLRLFVA